MKSLIQSPSLELQATYSFIYSFIQSGTDSITQPQPSPFKRQRRGGECISQERLLPATDSSKISVARFHTSFFLLL